MRCVWVLVLDDGVCRAAGAGDPGDAGGSTWSGIHRSGGAGHEEHYHRDDIGSGNIAPWVSRDTRDMSLSLPLSHSCHHLNVNLWWLAPRSVLSPCHLLGKVAVAVNLAPVWLSRPRFCPARQLTHRALRLSRVSPLSFFKVWISPKEILLWKQSQPRHTCANHVS